MELRKFVSKKSPCTSVRALKSNNQSAQISIFFSITPLWNKLKVVLMVKEHIEDSALTGNRDNTKEIIMSSSGPRGLIVANEVVQGIPSSATSSHV